MHAWNAMGSREGNRVRMYALALAGLVALNVALAVMLPGASGEAAPEAAKDEAGGSGQVARDPEGDAGVPATELASQDALGDLGDDGRRAVAEALAEWLEGQGLDPAQTLVHVEAGARSVSETPVATEGGEAAQNPVGNDADRVVLLGADGVEGTIAVVHTSAGTWEVAHAGATRREAADEGPVESGAVDAPGEVTLSGVALPEDLYVPEGLDAEAAVQWRDASREGLSTLMGQWCRSHDVQGVGSMRYGSGREERDGSVVTYAWPCVVTTVSGGTVSMTIEQSESGHFAITESDLR